MTPDLCIVSDWPYPSHVLHYVWLLTTLRHSWLITGFFCNKSYTKAANSGAGTAYPSGSLELTPFFGGVRTDRSLVLCVCFLDHCLYICPFSFGHYVASSCSNYGVWFPLWYPQTFVFFLLFIALPVLLRRTASDYPFGMYKLFLLKQ